jgi:hypothetical protein
VWFSSVPQLLPTMHKQLQLKRSLATCCNLFVELSTFTSKHWTQFEDMQLVSFMYHCCVHQLSEYILIRLTTKYSGTMFSSMALSHLPYSHSSTMRYLWGVLSIQVLISFIVKFGRKVQALTIVPNDYQGWRKRKPTGRFQLSNWFVVGGLLTNSTSHLPRVMVQL